MGYLKAVINIIDIYSCYLITCKDINTYICHVIPSHDSDNY